MDRLAIQLFSRINLLERIQARKNVATHWPYAAVSQNEKEGSGTILGPSNVVPPFSHNSDLNSIGCIVICINFQRPCIAACLPIGRHCKIALMMTWHFAVNRQTLPLPWVLLWFQPGIAPCDARLICKMCQSQNVPFGCMFVTLDPLSGNCRSTHCAFCVNSKFGSFHEISWPQWDPRFLQMSEWKPMHVPQVLNVELADQFNPNNKLGGSLSNIPCQIFVHCRLKSKMIYRKISHFWKHSANVPSFGFWNHQLHTAD